MAIHPFQSVPFHSVQLMGVVTSLCDSNEPTTRRNGSSTLLISSGPRTKISMWFVNPSSGCCHLIYAGLVNLSCIWCSCTSLPFYCQSIMSVSLFFCPCALVYFSHSVCMCVFVCVCVFFLYVCVCVNSVCVDLCHLSMCVFCLCGCT